MPLVRTVVYATLCLVMHDTTLFAPRPAMPRPRPALHQTTLIFSRSTHPLAHDERLVLPRRVGRRARAHPRALARSRARPHPRSRRVADRVERNRDVAYAARALALQHRRPRR